MIHTPGGVGYEIVVPLGVMERLPAVGQTVSLATELVVRDDGWSLYGFQDDAGRRYVGHANFHPIAHAIRNLGKCDRAAHFVARGRM